MPANPAALFAHVRQNVARFRDRLGGAFTAVEGAEYGWAWDAAFGLGARAVLVEAHGETIMHRRGVCRFHLTLRGEGAGRLGVFYPYDAAEFRASSSAIAAGIAVPRFAPTCATKIPPAISA